MAAKSELKEQTDRAQALESAKERVEAESRKRNRSLEELTEKSRRVLRGRGVVMSCMAVVL